MEYLQLVAAAAVDRTRKQSANTAGDAAGAVTSWTTGWRESPGGCRPAHPEPRSLPAPGS